MEKEKEGDRLHDERIDHKKQKELLHQSGRRKRITSLSFTNKNVQALDPSLSKKLQRRSIESLLKIYVQLDLEQKPLLFDSEHLQAKLDHDNAQPYKDWLEMLYGHIPHTSTLQELVEKKFSFLKYLTHQMLSASQKEENEENIREAVLYKQKVMNEELGYYRLVYTDRGEYYKKFAQAMFKAAKNEEEPFRKRILYNCAENYCKKAKISFGNAHQAGNMEARKLLYATAACSTKINNIIQASDAYNEFKEIVEKANNLRKKAFELMQMAEKTEKLIFKKEEKLAVLSPKKLILKRLNKKNLNSIREIIEEQEKELASKAGTPSGEEIQKTIVELQDCIQQKNNHEIKKKVMEHEIDKLKKQHFQELEEAEKLHLEFASLYLEAFYYNPQAELIDQIQAFLNTALHIQQRKKAIYYSPIPILNMRYFNLLNKLDDAKKIVDEVTKDVSEPETSFKEENIRFLERTKESNNELLPPEPIEESSQYKQFIELFFPTKKRFSETEIHERMKTKFKLLKELFNQFRINSRKRIDYDVQRKDELKKYDALIKEGKLKYYANYYYNQACNFRQLARKNGMLGQAAQNTFKKRIYLQKAHTFAIQSQSFFSKAYKKGYSKSKKLKEEMAAFAQDIKAKIEVDSSIDFETAIKKNYQKKNAIIKKLHETLEKSEAVKEKQNQEHSFPKKLKKETRHILEEKTNQLIEKNVKLWSSLEVLKEKAEDSKRLPIEHDILEIQENIERFREWLKHKKYNLIAEKIDHIEIQELKEELVITLNQLQDDLLVLTAELLYLFNQNPKGEYLEKAETILDDIMKIDSEKFALSNVFEVKNEIDLLRKKIVLLKAMIINPEKVPDDTIASQEK